MTLEIVRGHPKVPSCGWNFHDHGQNFTGRDADEVIRKLTEYRTQNSLPLGDPEQELAAYYAEQAPYLVRERPTQPIETNGVRQRVAEHTMGIWYGKFQRLPVHNEQVRERLAVCVSCTHFHHDFHDGESSYWREAATRAALMTGDMDCAEKGHCDYHHWIISLAARLVTPAKLATMPAPSCCWVQAP